MKTSRLLIFIIALLLISAPIFYFSLFGQRESEREITAIKSEKLKRRLIQIQDHLFYAEIADTEGARTQGLSYRDEMAEGEGMLFIFPKADRYGIWMKEMKFPIDIIWIQGDRILGFTENAVPEPGTRDRELAIYYPPAVIDKVLEVNAGLVGRFGLKVGGVIVIK